ncbi:MAG: DUF6320 domain-containing protein [Oscillibacter sp.]|jgi:hypothetical protein|nr:DUF6320 domain-containing protein [Oscillibacter sp.]
MPYCVNCGVELSAAASVCPLCHTPVWHPAEAEETAQPPFFPTNREEVRPVSKRALALLASAMLASAALCCRILNFFLRPGQDWWLYVAGAAVMLWIWFVAPLLARRIPLWGRLTLDVFAVGIYLFVISLATGGDWFFHLALPILSVAAVLVFSLSFLLRDRRRSRLSGIALTIGTAGLFALGIEFFADRYLFGDWKPGWSLVVLTICIALIIPLRVVRRMPSLRDEARRRFHM